MLRRERLTREERAKALERQVDEMKNKMKEMSLELELA
jgi:hypothetical protein